MASRNAKRRRRRRDKILEVCGKSTYNAREHYSGQGVEKSGFKCLPKSGIGAMIRKNAAMGTGGLINGGHNWTSKTINGIPMWRPLTLDEKSKIQIENRGLLNLSLLDRKDLYKGRNGNDL